MRRTRISTGLVMLAILSMLAALASTASAGAQSADPDSVVLDAEGVDESLDPMFDVDLNIQYWMMSREEYGLKADENFVRRIAVRKIGIDAIAEYSFPLTKNETARMVLRDTWTAEASRLIDMFEDHPAFGGLYLGEHLGDGLIVNVVGNPQGLKRDIRVAVDIPRTKLKFVKVDHALGELDGIAEQIVIAAGAESEDGIQGAYIDEITNEVVVEFEDDQILNKAKNERRNARSEMERSGGKGQSTWKEAKPVRLERGEQIEDAACSSRTNCGSGTSDFRGGIVIDGPEGDCTAGFAAEKPNGNKYLITAGHCDINPNDRDVTIGGQPHVSGIHQFIQGSNVHANNSNADAVLVGIEASKAGPWVFQSTSKPVHRITSVKPGLNYVARARICSAALKTYYRCGKIVTSRNLNVRDNVTGILTKDVVKWRYYEPGNFTRNMKGSSGGPVYSWGLALGITKASGLHNYQHEVNRTEVTMYASKIAHVEDLLGVSVITG